MLKCFLVNVKSILNWNQTNVSNNLSQHREWKGCIIRPNTINEFDLVSGLLIFNNWTKYKNEITFDVFKFFNSNCPKKFLFWYAKLLLTSFHHHHLVTRRVTYKFQKYQKYHVIKPLFCLGSRAISIDVGWRVNTLNITLWITYTISPNNEYLVISDATYNKENIALLSTIAVFPYSIPNTASDVSLILFNWSY